LKIDAGKTYKKVKRKLQVIKTGKLQVSLRDSKEVCW